MSGLELKNICKVYSDGVVAIDRFSVGMADGEFIVFAGPEGCGKSTILRVIAGVDDADSGEINLGGKALNAVPAKNRDIAFLLRYNTLFPQMTVYDNIAYALRMAELSDEETTERVNETANILGLERVLGELPGGLAGGVKRSIVLARAIVRKPRVLLMDEPFYSLEAAARLELLADIVTLSKKIDASIIYATGNPAEVLSVESRIVLMKGGVIQQTGRVDELKQRPANMFVADFLKGETA